MGTGLLYRRGVVGWNVWTFPAAGAPQRAGKAGVRRVYVCRPHALSSVVWAHSYADTVVTPRNPCLKIKRSKKKKENKEKHMKQCSSGHTVQGELTGLASQSLNGSNWEERLEGMVAAGHCLECPVFNREL